MKHLTPSLKYILAGLLCLVMTFSTALAQDAKAPMSTNPAPDTEQFQQENEKTARKLGNFYVRPTHPNAISPSVIIVEMKPGDTLKDSISIENPTEYEMTLNVHGADSALTAEGEFTVEAMDKIPDEFGSWVTFEEPNITLLPKETREVNFTLHIPEDIPYGEYQGGMAVTQTGNRSGKGIQISTTIAMGVKVTVTADPQPIPAYPGSATAVEGTNVFGTPTPYFWGSVGIFALGVAYFVYGTLRERKKKKQQVSVETTDNA